MEHQAYFAPLVVMPDLITGPGKYVTRSGETVSVDAVSGHGGEFGCRGSYADGTRERWHRSGRLLASREMDNDIVRQA